MRKCIILIGPPASGKGTQADILCKAIGYHIVSTGTVLRKEISSSGKDASVIKEKVDSGELVDIEIIQRLMDRECQVNKENILFDGFPRSMDQVLFLDEICNRIDMNISRVIHLNVQLSTILERISKRAICDSCGYTGIIHDGIFVCAECECSSYVLRSDDKSDKIAHRYEIYENSIREIMSFYSNKVMCHNVNGDRRINSVSEDIMKCIR